MQEQLFLSGVTRIFGGVDAVSNMTLGIRRGEFLTLLGPSGSGKTTVLNMIAGFLAPTAGRILLDGEDITHTPPHRRQIGMVFQDYALFPHMTVFENIAFPLRMRRMPVTRIRALVTKVLESVKLPGMEQRYPAQLSGGQKQRIALARAIVFNPGILLMDEPMSALDEKLRKHMRSEIKQLQRSLDITVVLVTHNQDEALSMSDRIAVINHGCVIQVDTPDQIYEKPANIFVADFIGESNFLSGRVGQVTDGVAAVEIAAGIQLLALHRNGQRPGAPVTVMVRPEKIAIAGSRDEVPAETGNVVPGTIVNAVYGGDAIVCEVALAREMLLSVKLPGFFVRKWEPGQEVYAHWSSKDSITLEADEQPPR